MKYEQTADTDIGHCGDIHAFTGSIRGCKTDVVRAGDAGRQDSFGRSAEVITEQIRRILQ